jgi:phage terminase small subunit
MKGSTTDSDELTQKQKLFVTYYCTDPETRFNATKSYQKAYSIRKHKVPEATAAAQSSKLLKRPAIKEAIRAELALFQNETDTINTYRILELYRTLAFYDPADIITKKGDLKADSIEELGELSRAISGIIKHINKDGTLTIEIKLADRYRAMENLAKYLNLIRPDTAIDVTVPVIFTTEKKD